MEIFISFLKDKRKQMLLFISYFGIMVLVFFLYSARLDMVAYAFLLCMALGAIVETGSFLNYARKYKKLEYAKKKIRYDMEEFPEAEGRIEEMYREMVTRLFEEKRQIESQNQIEKKELEEYYMLWAHQIKTPIAAMNILLQSGEVKPRELSAELFKIEQYVEMVLGYLRTEQMNADLTFKEYDLLDVIRQAVRKYSRLFILQRIQLNLEEMDYSVITDEKWLLFAIEQILSNALKYTKEGSISIYMSKDRKDTLVIEDTGIGISPEDLPRVVEKGFTGYNGRDHKKSTGLGLYLSKEILAKLNHKLTLESEVGVGTKVFIYLGRSETADRMQLAE